MTSAYDDVDAEVAVLDIREMWMSLPADIVDALNHMNIQRVHDALIVSTEELEATLCH